MAPETMAAQASIGATLRRLRAAWMLVVLLLAQMVPVAAFGAADGMGHMACCRNGKASCCKRKPMAGGTAVRAGHPCGSSCCGVPGVAAAGVGVLAAPGLVPVLAGFADFAVSVRVERAPMASGYDASRFQRPPPFVL